MQIDIYAEDDTSKQHVATYVVSGIEGVAKNEVSSKEGSSKPKVTLSFELTRSGIL